MKSDQNSFDKMVILNEVTGKVSSSDAFLHGNIPFIYTVLPGPTIFEAYYKILYSRACFIQL